MNKFLNIFRVILFVILVLLNGYCIFFKTNFISWSHVVYVFFLAIILVITIIDIIKKNGINHNNTYCIISILVFLIMNVILFRTLFDSHLFFNNLKLINEYEKYSELAGSYAGNFSEYAKLYFKQNMIYFNAMLLLLFVYRKINLVNNAN